MSKSITETTEPLTENVPGVSVVLILSSGIGMPLPSMNVASVMIPGVYGQVAW